MLRHIARGLSIIVLLVLVATLVAGCDGGGDEPPAPTTVPTDDPRAGFPVTLTSSDGRELTLERRPERMVVLSPGHVETLFAIGAGGQIVAVDQNTDYPPQAAQIELKLSGLDPSVEQIVALDPDLIILSYAPEGFVEQLTDLGARVFYDDINTEITTVEGVFESIQELGLATGHADEADALVVQLQQRLDAVEQAVAGVTEGPRYYHELDEQLFSIGADTFAGDLYTKLKAENIADPALGPYPALNQEAIIAGNPEVIVLTDAEFGQTPEVVAQRPGWNAIDAVINDRVYAIDPDIVSRPGPRVIDALEELASLLYPDLFATPEARAPCSVCYAVSR